MIHAETTDEMVEIVALLVRQGLTFTARKTPCGWEVSLTGGY